MPKINIGSNNTSPSHIFVGHTPVKKVLVGAGTGDQGLVWKAEPPPIINSFSVSPASIDLDNVPSGTISFSLNVSGTTGEDTYAQVIRLPDGTNIGTTFVGAGGSGINQTLPNIPQPSQNTTYRLIARNNGGASHLDASIQVTQDPLIDSFVILRYVLGGPSGGSTAYMRAIFKGYPQPSLRADNGIGVLNSRHFTPAGETNTWQIEFSHYIPRGTPPRQRIITLTATNSSGSNTREVTTDAI